jgi:5S rRNA maturation endonuclease (ribonuclease M5)
MSEAEKFGRLMGPVAERVLQESLGKPNRKLSTKTEIRYGTNGSLAVDITKGVYQDHEDGTGGGVLDLLKAYKGLGKSDAVKWLQDNGFLEKSEGKQQANVNIPGIPDFFDPKPIAAFDYLDDKGNLAIQVVKFPKEAARRYMQRRPGPGGSWIWALDEAEYGKTKDGHWFRAKEGGKYSEIKKFPKATRWLYRRDEVLKAKADGRPVLLVEGEKDVETLRSWGFAATTNCGGAKFWEDRYDDDLAGADVILCGDNDDAGRMRMMNLGHRLKKKAKSVRVIDLVEHWPEMPEKGDVSDWRDKAGGTAEKFADIVKSAPMWAPKRPKSMFGAIPWSDRKRPRKRLEFLVEGWLTEQGVSFMGGPSGSGKSFLAFHLAMCVARGIDFFDNPVKRGGVIYQAGEGGLGFLDRMDAYAKHFSVPDDEDVPFELLPSKINIFSKDSKDVDNLISEINALSLTMSAPVELFVIDTLSKATVGADEISGKDTAVILSNVERIRDECGVNVMVVHHMNAKGEKMRGHTSLKDNADQVIFISHDKDTGIREANLEKMKDGEDGLRFRFSLASIPVRRNDRTGADVTSCVVLSVTEKERLKKEQQRLGFSPNPTERRVLMNLFAASDRYGKFVATEADGPRAAVGKIIINWTAYKAVAMESMVEVDDKVKAADQVKKELGRTKTSLQKYGIIGVNSPYLWWDGKPVRGFSRTFPEGSEFGTKRGQDSDNQGTSYDSHPDDDAQNDLYAEAEYL